MSHSSPSLRAADTIDRCLSQILKYVEDVQAGKVPSNPRVGRLLMESVLRVPKIDNTRFEAMLNSTMQVLALCSQNCTEIINGRCLPNLLYKQKGFIFVDSVKIAIIILYMYAG